MKKISKARLRSIAINNILTENVDHLYDSLEDCTYKNGDKCIVHNCVNRKGQGRFVGDICGPCYKMITTGEDNPSTNFIHKLHKKESESIKWPPCILLLEKTLNPFKFPVICKKCESSIKQTFFGKNLGCIHPECEDYYKRRNCEHKYR